MESTLIIGIVIIAGFILGEIVERIGFPKVTGYIIAGIILNPDLSNFIPEDFTDSATPVTNIALAFITFSVGGTLLYSRIRKLGRDIFSISMFEAEFAFIVVTGGFLAISWMVIDIPDSGWLATFIPVSLLIGSLASPTDPSATLAVAHEYKSKGDVTSTIMGVAASDDALGIINFSLAVVAAHMCISHQGFDWNASVSDPMIDIIGSIGIGILFGLALNVVTKYIQRESEGVLIVVILGSLALCFGIAQWLEIDRLLATMSMGIMIINFNPRGEAIFQIMERYTEELIFVIFFTLSGMYLNFSVLGDYWMLVLAFVVFRSLGKISGTLLGAHVAGSSPLVKKYTAGGLIPQGGIVIGLALLAQQEPALAPISHILLNVIIGATVIHELIGPLTAKLAITKSGEAAQPH